MPFATYLNELYSLINPSMLFEHNTFINIDTDYGRITRPVTKQRLFDSSVLRQLMHTQKTFEQSVVYIVLNALTGQFYLDRSEQIYTDVYRHRNMLHNHQHTLPPLQAAYDQGGEMALHITVIYLEDAEEAQLIELYLQEIFAEHPSTEHLGIPPLIDDRCWDS